MVKGLEELHTIQTPAEYVRQELVFWLNYDWDFMFTEGRKLFYGDTNYWIVKKTPI